MDRLLQLYENLGVRFHVRTRVPSAECREDDTIAQRRLRAWDEEPFVVVHSGGLGGRGHRILPVHGTRVIISSG